MSYDRFNKYKILFYQDRLTEIAMNLIPDPVLWYVYPANKCNLACDHCIMKEERRDVEMLSPATMRKIPLDAARNNIKTVIFSGGGEPLLNKSVPAIAMETRDNDIKVGLNTNGVLLNDVIKDVPHFKECFDFIRVSVDASDRETYEKVHGVDHFDNVISGVEKLASLYGDTEVGVSYLITEDNIGGMEKFCELMKDKELTYIHFRPAHYEDNRMERYQNIIYNQKTDIEAKYPNAYVRVEKFDGHWTPKLYTKCHANPLIAVTTASGQFAICQDVFIKWGDYNKKSFRDIWYSEEHREAMKKIDITKCPRCVEVGYNEIIENCVLTDGLKKEII